METKKKKPKWKKFSKMNPEEKAERIKFLWDKVRMHVKQLTFVNKTQQEMEDQFLTQFAQQVEFDPLN